MLESKGRPQFGQRNLKTDVDAFIKRYNLTVLCGGGGDPCSRAIMKELTVDKYIREHMIEQDLFNTVIVGDRTKYFLKEKGE